MDFDIWYYEQQTDIGYSEMKKAFEAGQQSKQAEIDALKAKIDAALNKIDALSWASESDVEEIKELLK